MSSKGPSFGARFGQRRVMQALKKVTPLSVCVCVCVSECMHIYAHCICLRMHKSVWTCVYFLLWALKRSAEHGAVSGCGLSSISQVWHVQAFCTNTVQWSGLHSNPAIMTAVCVSLLVTERAKEEKEKQNRKLRKKYSSLNLKRTWCVGLEAMSIRPAGGLTQLVERHPPLLGSLWLGVHHGGNLPQTTTVQSRQD